MTHPRIILACPRGRAPDDAIVIDHLKQTFWRGGNPWTSHGRTYETPVKFRIFAALLLRAPHIVTHDELLDHVYGDDPEGGPDAAMDSVNVTICRAKSDLAPWLGIKITALWGRGYRAEFIEQSTKQPIKLAA